MASIQHALRECGAVLVRQRKHLVYRLPNGRPYTMSQTPSDHRAARNQLTVLRRQLRPSLP